MLEYKRNAMIDSYFTIWKVDFSFSVDKLSKNFNRTNLSIKFEFFVSVQAAHILTESYLPAGEAQLNMLINAHNVLVYWLAAEQVNYGKHVRRASCYVRRMSTVNCWCKRRWPNDKCQVDVFGFINLQ